MLDKNDRVAGNPPADIVSLRSEQTDTIDIAEAGVYRIDVIRQLFDPTKLPADASRLDNELIGYWPLDKDGSCASDPALNGRVLNDAQWKESPFGGAVHLDGKADAVVVERTAAMDVGAGDFTVSTWIHPQQLRQGGIVCLGKYSWTHGWYLDMPDNRGTLRIETAGPDSVSMDGTVVTAPGTIVAGQWQHVTAVVQRGNNATRLYVNGYPVAKGTIGPAMLDNPKVNLHIGRIQDAQAFHGAIDEVRIYRRSPGR